MALVILFALGCLLAGGGTSLAQQPGSSASQKTLTDTQKGQILSYIEMLRSDVRTQKKAVLAKAMQFTETEAGAFWPIYSEYESKLATLGDERLDIIKTYAANWQQMTDKLAHDLAQRSLAVQKERTCLLKKYYKRIEKALSAKRAARFLQVENALNMVVDLQVAASLPLVQ
jgi:hypothetical protein